MGPHYLEYLFSPRGIAVFGASDRTDSVGGRVYSNLINEGFTGAIVPINPKYRKLNRKKCYPDLEAVTEQLDLAVIATPSKTVAAIIEQCGNKGIHAAIILSAGFTEKGGKTNSYFDKTQETARKHGIRLLGPNCLGIIRPKTRLNATFSHNSASRGKLALISQSGALCTAILDWAEHRDIGFSAVVSLGDAADIDFGSLLDYFALDNETHGILLYIEGIKDSRSFMSGLRSAARLKPVVVLKAGRHEAAAKAALSHTGSLVGADDVFAAAIKRSGVVRAETISQLFAASQLLAHRHQIRGNRLVIITNGGGPAIMATDRAQDLGIRLASLSEQTIEMLNQAMPAHWSGSNPVDVLGDAASDRYKQAISICLEDSEVDGVLVLLTPQAMTDPLAVAEKVVSLKATTNKVVITCWMGYAQVESSRKLFSTNQIPTFTTPESAIEAFSYLVEYYQNQRLLKEVPGPLKESSEPDVEGARLIVEAALNEKRQLLTRRECNAILRAFAIPVMPVENCTTANEALIAAESFGFPVAMKIDSPDITHKTDVDGVRLNIAQAEQVRRQFQDLIESVKAKQPNARISGVTIEPMYHRPHGRELMLGVIRDAVFGPVITFGAGGTMLEVIRDREIAIPPLNTRIIKELIANTRVSKMLEGYRNQPAVNKELIVDVLRHLSEMICELPQIKELDINPFIVNEEGGVAVDVRMVVDTEYLGLTPYQHMAIHPYPAHLKREWQLGDGHNVIIRPIRPEDASIESAFIDGLSEQTKYFRFMQALQKLTPEMLVRFTQIDYDREMALIAVINEPGNNREIGVARFITNPDANSCEFAIVVADEWTHKGIGKKLMQELIQIARLKGLHVMEGEVLANNHPMLDMAKSLGFSVMKSEEDPSVMLVKRGL